MYVSQRTLVCLHLKLEIWLERCLTSCWVSPKNAPFNGKTPFLWLANTGVKPPFFKTSRLKLQKLLKSCWPSKTEKWLRWVTFWSNFVRIATHSGAHLWSMTKSPRKREFHPFGVFSTRALLRQGRHVKQ